jgi:hypothetical protein
MPDVNIPKPAPKEEIVMKRVDAPPPPPPPKVPHYARDENGIWNFTKDQEQAIREYLAVKEAKDKNDAYLAKNRSISEKAA